MNPAPTGSSSPRLLQLPFVAARVRSGTLAFEGRATVGDVLGTTSTVTGSMSGGPTWGGITGWVEAPVATLVTGNRRRDRDLNKSMESEQYPTLRFDLDRVEVGSEETGGDSADVTLHGRFTVHGVVRDVVLPAGVRWWMDSVRVGSRFPLNLKDYRIGGLSKMLGMLRMDPEIVVRVGLLFERAAADSAPPAAGPRGTPPSRGWRFPG